jgi:hypothetical protein
VNNTIVKKAAAEYSGAAGINVGYTIGTTLTHNDVHDLSYVGISVGWGWGTPDIAGWATIAWNKVHNYKQLLNDGGGIYMLGSQVGPAARDRASPTYGAEQLGPTGNCFSRWCYPIKRNCGG